MAQNLRRYPSGDRVGRCGRPAMAVVAVGCVLLLGGGGRALAQAGLPISGTVTYYSNGVAVPDVTVNLQGPSPATTTTALDGQYGFTDLSGETWLIQPQRNGGRLNSISALDAVYVLQYTVGLRSLSLNQRLACDVTGNGTVSALDASYILQYTVGLRDRMPVAERCGSDWLFVPVPGAAANQQILQPTPSAPTCQPGAIRYDPLASPATNQDFLGIVFGDCTGNWGGAPPPATTPTPTNTPPPTATRTQTNTPTIGSPTPTPAGPVVVAFEVVGANGCPLWCIRPDNFRCECIGQPTATPQLDDAGRRVFDINGGSGFIVVVEAKPRPGGPDVGRSVRPTPTTGRPDLQIQANRPLGNGSAAVCDKTRPGAGGVPGIDPASFADDSGITSALVDFACRFNDGVTSSTLSCTLGPDGEYSFLSSETTTQFCLPPVNTYESFPGGDTVLTVRVRDAGGSTGPEAQIVVRVPTPTPTWVP